MYCNVLEPPEDISPYASRTHRLRNSTASFAVVCQAKRRLKTSQRKRIIVIVSLFLGRTDSQSGTLAITFL